MDEVIVVSANESSAVLDIGSDLKRLGYALPDLTFSEEGPRANGNTTASKAKLIRLENH